MNKEEESLWGDLSDVEVVPTPKRYLRQQARKLSTATGFTLSAEVTQEVSYGRISLDLDIVARELNNYRYTVLQVSHGLDFYPLTMQDFANSKKYECKNEEEFLAALKEVLSSPAVRKVVSALLSQSK